MPWPVGLTHGWAASISPIKMDPKMVPRPTTVHRKYKSVARTYPLRIGVLRFQVYEQLLRVPMKQRRKVCDSGVSNVIRHWIGGQAEMIKVD